MDWDDQTIEIIGISRDTPVSSQTGKVTIICKKAKSPRPSIGEVRKRLLEIGFCNDKTIFEIKFEGDSNAKHNRNQNHFESGNRGN